MPSPRCPSNAEMRSSLSQEALLFLTCMWKIDEVDSNGMFLRDVVSMLHSQVGYRGENFFLAILTRLSGVRPSVSHE